MNLHAFLLLFFLMFSLALLCTLCWLHQGPAQSRAAAKMRTTLHRLLKPRCPDDCPACRLVSTASSGGGPAPLSVRPWCEVKSRRGAPKRVNTEGFACPNQQCPYFGITDAHIHALVGDGKHGRAEHIQTFRGPACRTTFTSRRNTALYRLKTPSYQSEESHHPRRTVPRAILLAVVIIGVFFALCAYAGVNAWGINHITDYPNNPNPWGALAARVWGPFAFIAVLAIINSDVANENAGVNVLSRMLFAFGRIRTLPAVLGQTNRFATPGVAVIVSVVLGTILTIWLGLVYGVTTAYALVGALLTIPLLLVYMLTCVAVPIYYLREHRDEFNLVRHVLVPAIPFVVLAITVYFQFVPAPPAPINLAGPISAAWLVLGIVIVVILSWRAPKALALTNAIYTEGQGVDNSRVEKNVQASKPQAEVASATEAQGEE